MMTTPVQKIRKIILELFEFFFPILFQFFQIHANFVLIRTISSVISTPFLTPLPTVKPPPNVNIC